MVNYPTYTFSQMPIKEIIAEAYDRCGLIESDTDQYKRTSALRSLNLMLSEWVNKGLNLFTIAKSIIPINAGQNSYPVPAGFVDVMEMTASQFTRQLGGAPFSSAGGVASNAFDGNPATSCTQTAPNGYISYNYGSTSYQICYVGIQSNVNRVYTLNFEYSQDGTTWISAMETGPQTYLKGSPLWYVLPIPPTAFYWRVREEGGAILDLEEIYFDIPSVSLLMQEISREDWWAAPNKTNTASLTSYYVERTNTPAFFLYPVPDGTYQYFLFTYTRQMPDVVSFTDTLGVPQRFLDAAIAGLASRVSQKFYPQKYDILKAEAEDAYTLAAGEDIQRVPLRITPNWVSYT